MNIIAFGHYVIPTDRESPTDLESNRNDFSLISNWNYAFMQYIEQHN